jgi:hypothetical protein
MKAMLELLLAEDGAAEPPVVALQLGGRADEPLVSGLLETVPAATRRVLPAPPTGAAPADVRSWYCDLWWALPERERRSIVGAGGPGAACLVLLLDRESRVVAAVREPLHALVATGARLPNRAALRSLRDDPRRSFKPRLRAVSNSQARELLLPWTDGDELPVTVGPPPDADRWRRLLFEDALPRLQPAPFVPGAPVPPDPAALPGGPAYQELLLALNWLDQELHANYS